MGHFSGSGSSSTSSAIDNDYAEIMSIILEAYFRSNMPPDLNGDELVDLCVSCIVKNGYDTKQSLLSDKAFIKYDVLGLKNVKDGGLPHRFVMTIYKTIEDLDKELLSSATSRKDKLQKVLTVMCMYGTHILVCVNCVNSRVRTSMSLISTTCYSRKLFRNQFLTSFSVRLVRTSCLTL